MPETFLNVQLLRHTFDPEQAAALAARLCYTNTKISELKEKVTKEKAVELLKKIIKMGHHSILEHVAFTFGVEGISRACSHQLVRHRIASYSQQSQRYCKLKDFNYIIPPSVKANTELLEKFNAKMLDFGASYEEFLNAGLPAEDARFLLPNACETKIIISMNVRSLYNFFQERTCNRAQWEIRAMALQMLEHCKKVAPVIFENAGPRCVKDKVCIQGSMSCGRWKSIPGARLME